MSLTSKDLYGLTHYEYGVPYTGSIKGMRYYIAREPLENVFGKKDVGEAELKVQIWRGPISWDLTPEEEKETFSFPFEAESLHEIAELLNARYEEKPEYWAEGMKLIP